MDQALEMADIAKEKLSNLYGKYDFASIDEAEISLAQIENWSNDVMKLLSKLWRYFGSTFECGLCKNEAIKCTTLQCDHVFCSECLYYN